MSGTIVGLVVEAVMTGRGGALVDPAGRDLSRRCARFGEPVPMGARDQKGSRTR